MDAAYIALVIASALPPAQYDFEPPVWHLERTPAETIGAVCDMPNPELTLMGCALGPRLLVVIRSDLKGELYDAVLRHEWAHLNGWSHD